MPLLAQRIFNGLKPAQFSRTRPPATESHPDRILLGPRPGEKPSTKPAVRIYLGSERHQFRAERAFLWSIEKHRDPSRAYEIYLMRDLAGFRRGFWLTGFTNYRFAIPAFANYQGRAIYNDADQVYLKDPALLFDQEMGDAGFLSINDRDTSVMLIDCERMAKVWNEVDVRSKGRKQLEAAARAQGLWGDLDDGWNARDKEYDPETSHLVHFTTLHTQPWRPFPSQLVYFDNPTKNLWPDIEKDANKNRFLPFGAVRPSRHWNSVLLYLSSKNTSQPYMEHLGPHADSASKVRSIEIQDLLEHVPDQDVLWVLVKLFSASEHLSIHIKEPIRHGHGKFKRSAAFWLEHLALVEQMEPKTRWTLRHRASPFANAEQYHGGPALQGSVVHLTHRKPGHNQQALALATNLARTLSRPHHKMEIGQSEIGFVLSHWIARRPIRQQLPNDACVLVAGGWLATKVARAYQRQYPYLRIVLSGRKAGPVPTHGGVTVQCKHFALPPHPMCVQTLVPVNLGHYGPCEQSTAWTQWLESSHKIACLLGGNTKSFRYTTSDMESLAKGLLEASQHNARILVVGSRRSSELLSALRQFLEDDALFYEWKPKDPQNPYSLALEQADKLVVTGESESMLADAVSTGKGFEIFYPKKSLHRQFDRAADWVAKRAIAPQYNRRGSIRPQQGLQYLCARALERHWILPPRDLEGLHQSLMDRGMAAMLGDSRPGHFPVPRILEEVTNQVISKLHLNGQTDGQNHNDEQKED